MEKKKLKEEIKKTLKSYALSKDLLAKSLNLNIEDIEDALDSLVLSGEIKYLENLELYKLASKKKSKEYASIDEDLLLSLIKDEHIYHFNVLAKRLKVNPKELKACLNALVKENKIYYSAFYDIYTILKVATLDVKDKGYAFAKVDGEDIEYYIPKEDIGTAYDGDICHIFPTGYDDKLKGASVYDVIERAHKIVIGKLTLKGKKYPKYKVISTMNSFKVEVDVKEEDLNGAKPGEIVSCDIEYTKGYSIKGKITEIIGHPDDPGIEIAEIALEYGFKMPFSEETVEELKVIPDTVKIEEIYGRRDFRNLNVITIDGDDSKDFDDAIYLEKNSNGNYNLQVHIADVSYYVKEASPLDKDALSRGTSVYLADRVIPMIPHKLSNGICSLNEGVDRLVLSCLMEIDPKGKLINYEIVEGVINSHHRMTYNSENHLNPYILWDRNTTSDESLFVVGIGGNLYPPHSLHPLVGNTELAYRLTPTGDDIWLNAMARLQNTPIIHTPYHFICQIPVIYIHNVDLFTSNVPSENNIQITNLIAYLKEKFGVNPFEDFKQNKDNNNI